MCCVDIAILYLTFLCVLLFPSLCNYMPIASYTNMKPAVRPKTLNQYNFLLYRSTKTVGTRRQQGFKLHVTKQKSPCNFLLETAMIKKGKAPLLLSKNIFLPGHMQNVQSKDIRG